MFQTNFYQCSFTIIHYFTCTSLYYIQNDFFKKMDWLTIYVFKGNNRNTRTRCEICSKLTIQTPEWCHWHDSTTQHSLKSFWRGFALQVVFGPLIHSMKFLSPEVAQYLFKSTIRPCMEYCCHLWAGTHSCYLELLDKL